LSTAGSRTTARHSPRTFRSSRVASPSGPPKEDRRMNRTVTDAPPGSTLRGTPPSEPVRAPRGPNRSCQGWQQEAALRMLMNNLDPDVAERPEDLVVYGGTGRAARSWPAFHAIVRSLRA